MIVQVIVVDQQLKMTVAYVMVVVLQTVLTAQAIVLILMSVEVLLLVLAV